jgi:hypothetical protein
VWACWWAEQQPTHRRRARWLARLSIAAFLLVGYAYYQLCKLVGMFIAWTFLMKAAESPPAWPAGSPAT